MIKVEKRNGYDAILVIVNKEQAAKAYVYPTGLVSNLYIRTKYRGNNEIIGSLMKAITSRYKHLSLFGYASPKKDKRKRPALIRLYRRYGFINTSTNKVIYDPNGK